MKMLRFLFISLLFLTGKSMHAQKFDVPRYYHLDSAADYVPYEKDMIDAAKWLMATPFNEQEEKRREVSRFVVKWVDGSPTVNVEINPTILDFEKKNEGMLVLYMACCAKYVLEHNYSKDMRAKHKSALRDMISVYKKGKGINKDKKMEKLMESDAEGKLDEWLDDNLKINPR